MNRVRSFILQHENAMCYTGLGLIVAAFFGPFLGSLVFDEVFGTKLFMSPYAFPILFGMVTLGGVLAYASISVSVEANLKKLRAAKDAERAAQAAQITALGATVIQYNAENDSFQLPLGWSFVSVEHVSDGILTFVIRSMGAPHVLMAQCVDKKGLRWFESFVEQL